MDQVLDNFSAWAELATAQALVEDASSGLFPEESLESLEEFRWMIWRLTSDLYGEPLSKILPEPVSVYEDSISQWAASAISEMLQESEDVSPEPSPEEPPSAESGNGPHRNR
jgi:hypothetical protein